MSGYVWIDEDLTKEQRDAVITAAKRIKVHSSAISIWPCLPGECPCTSCANERRGLGEEVLIIERKEK